MADYYYLLLLFRFVNKTIAIEYDNNRLDGMCYLGVTQLNIVFIIFSFLCDINEPSSRFGRPKLSTRKRSALSILFRNLRLTRKNGRYRFFENGKTPERSKFAPLSQVDCSKVKTLVWMCKS